MIRTACIATTLLAGALLPAASASAAVTLNGRVSQIINALQNGSHFSQGNFAFTIKGSGGSRLLFKGIGGVRGFEVDTFLNGWVDEQFEDRSVFDGGPYKFTHTVLDSYFNEPPKSSSVFDGGPYKFTHTVLNSYFDTPQPQSEGNVQSLLVPESLEFNAPPESMNLAVPEPATWAMMIGGFALVGASLRRRRAAARAA